MAVYRDTPYGQFNFRVDLGTGSPGKDDVKAGFQEISGLGMEVHVAEYRAGNSKENATQKITGSTKVDNIDLKRGVLGIRKPSTPCSTRSAMGIRPRAAP